MKFSAAIVTLATAGAALASPSATRIFDLMALRSAKPIDRMSFGAAQSSIFLNLREQDAKCKGDNHNQATFYILGDGLFLYNTVNITQQVFVNPHDQGRVGYTTKGPAAPYFELQGWAIDKNGDLNFQGSGLLACPGAIQDAWSIRLDTDNLMRGGNEGCLSLSARRIPNDKPISCEYSQ